MRVRRSGLFVPSRAALARTRTAWLMIQQDHSVRDLANGLGGTGVFPIGSTRIDTDEGPALSFNGTTNGTFGSVANLPPIDRLAFIARVRSTGAQPGNPGAAFGVYAGTAQGGLGIGFNGNNVGAAWLTSAGAGTAATVPTVQGQWYTVIVQGTPANPALTAVAAWVDGAPAVRAGTSNGAVNGPLNEVVIGAQHASSGYLRRFRGDVQWAAILVGDSANWMTDEIAAQLVADDYPYNLRRNTKSPILVASAAPPLGGSPGRLSMQGSQAAAVQRSITAAGSPGLFAMRGSQAGAVQRHIIAGAPGLLAMRGNQAAAVQRSITAAGSPGRFAWAGNQAAATTAEDVAGLPGLLAMRGNQAAAVQTHIPLGSPGLFSWRGISAAATQVHITAGSPGLMVLRGSRAGAYQTHVAGGQPSAFRTRGIARPASQTQFAGSAPGMLAMRGSQGAASIGPGLGEICDPTVFAWQDAYMSSAWQDNYSPIICGTYP